jgi:hypothetical protein
MQVWKYSLDWSAFQQLDMPRGAKVLSLQVQNGEPKVWVLVNGSEPHERRSFGTYATGETLPTGTDLGRFVGTYQRNGGDLVFHVFERA